MQTKWTGFTGKQLKSGALVLVFLLAGTSFFSIGGCNSGSNDSGYEQVCERDPEAELCSHSYALCIAASCDPETIDGNRIDCGGCDSDDGSCGRCYVFEGESCSFNAPCSEVEPGGDVVYSTYSDELSFVYGFDAMVCDNVDEQPFQADCMDAPCRLTGESVALTDVFGIVSMVPTAICDCVLVSPGRPEGTLGGLCNQDNCSAIWSTSSEHRGAVLDLVPQCSDDL